MSLDDLTLAELQHILETQVAALDADIRSVYERYARPPLRMLYSWQMGDRNVSKPIWVIARDGPLIVGYDEVEEEFGTGLVHREGIVEDWGTYGDRLRWTLLRFPDDWRGGHRAGDAQPVT